MDLRRDEFFNHLPNMRTEAFLAPVRQSKDTVFMMPVQDIPSGRTWHIVVERLRCPLDSKAWYYQIYSIPIRDDIVLDFEEVGRVDTYKEVAPLVRKFMRQIQQTVYKRTASCIALIKRLQW